MIKRTITTAARIALSLWLAVFGAAFLTIQPAAAALADEAPVGKLPATATPLSYDVRLRINPEETPFSGVVKIKIRLNEELGGIWLHGKDFEVQPVIITAPDGSSQTGTYTQVLETGVSYIAFENAMGPGEITAEIRYSGELSDNLAGLFRTQSQGDWYALTKSESIQARRAIPSFDEPRFKTPFRISLDVPQGLVAISNEPEIRRTPLRSRMVRFEFGETPPLPTFLLAMAVGPFDIEERPDIPPNEIRSRPIPLRGIARRGKAKDLAFTLDITPAFIEIFEKALKTPYPFTKLDIIAAPDWPSGATELAAAITYREPFLLVGDNPPPAAKRRLVNLHAHELAHMWFGDLVTPPWWDDLWLKEAFSTWGEPVAAATWDPDGGYDLDAARDALSAMPDDSLATARAVREPILRNEDIRNAYDSITYSKGMAVITMFEAYLGQEKFRAILAAYLDRFKNGVASSDQFFDFIGTQSREPGLADAFRGFIERPGLPTLTVQPACSSGNAPNLLQVTQARYRPLGSKIDPGRTWSIPACITYGIGARRKTMCRLLTNATSTLQLPDRQCPDWIMPNSKGLGYYRFVLPDGDWDALAAELPDLPAREAMAAVDSAIAGFEAGSMSADRLLAVFTAAARSPHRDVIMAPSRSLAHYKNQIVPSGRADRVSRFVAGLYQNRYDALRRPETDNERLLRTDLETVLAINGDVAAIRAGLAEAASAFIGYGQSRDPDALTSDQYRTALTVAVQDLGRPFFNALMAARSDIDDARFLPDSIFALARSTDPVLAEELRTLAMSPALTAAETYNVIMGQMQTREVQDGAWTWLKDNFREFVNKIPRQWRRRAPRALQQFCTPEKIRDAEALFAQYGALAPGHERPLAQAIEQVELCAALKAAKGDELASALR